MIVDPWGVVLAQAPDREAAIVADLDLEGQARVRATLPSLANRRPEVYERPVSTPATRAAARAGAHEVLA